MQCIILFLLLFSITSHANSPVCNLSAELCVEQGKRLLEEAKIEKSQAKFDRALLVFDQTCRRDSAIACMYLPIIYRAKNQNATAVPWEDYVCKKYPLECLGLISVYTKDRPERAIELAKPGCDKNNEPYCAFLIVAYLTTKNTKDLQPLSSKWCKVTGKIQKSACYSLGVVEAVNKNYSAAVTAFTKACELKDQEACEMRKKALEHMQKN